MKFLFIASIISSTLAAPLTVSAISPKLTSVQNIDNGGGVGPYGAPFFNPQAGPGPFFAPWNSPFGGRPGGFGGPGFGGPGFGGPGFGGPGGFGIGVGN